MTKRVSNLLKGYRQGSCGRAAIGRAAKQLVIGDDVRREGVLVDFLDCEGLRVKMSVGDIDGENTKKKRQRRINRRRRRTFSMVFQSVQ